MLANLLIVKHTRSKYLNTKNINTQTLYMVLKIAIFRTKIIKWFQ